MSFLALNININCTGLTEFNCLAHFSENWGYILLSPIFSLNLLSFLFGRTLDAHAGSKAIEDLFPTIFLTYGPPRCLEGRDCYVDAIYLTIGTSLLSFFLSFLAGYRDSCKAANGGGRWFRLCFFFKISLGCEVPYTFFGGYHSMNSLRILFESRLDFVIRAPLSTISIVNVIVTESEIRCQSAIFYWGLWCKYFVSLSSCEKKILMKLIMIKGPGCPDMMPLQFECLLQAPSLSSISVWPRSHSLLLQLEYNYPVEF